MLSMKEFMKKVNISKKRYVLDWIEKDLIPGVQRANNDEYLFPESARRPYIARCSNKASAKTIRASIVNACIKRRHISPSTYNLSDSEFESCINDLISCGLIVRREEDGIIYYDSTSKSDAYSNCDIKVIGQKVQELLAVVEPVLSIAASTVAIVSTLM